MARMKARHWAFLAMAVSVVSIAWTPDPADGVLVGVAAVLFGMMQEDLDD